jgi:hypothetical protein
MSLHIDFDPHGVIRIPFPEFRQQLLAEERPFTERELAKLPYTHLPFAAIANAGKARCSLDLVINEKVRRRDRFVTMSPEALDDAKRYLQIEGMFDDVTDALESREAPRWERCTERTKLWLKLNCIHDHTDNPMPRLKEVTELIRTTYEADQLKKVVADRFTKEIGHLRTFYPDAISDEELRDKTGSLAEELLSMLGDLEWGICEHGRIRDYSCTSDCYRNF